MKTILLSSLIAFFVFSSCNKYEEGSNFSIRSPEKRLRGTWALKEYYVDDLDKTGYVKSWFIDIYKGQEMSSNFDSTENYSKNYHGFYTEEANRLSQKLMVGKWGMSQDKTVLFLSFGDATVNFKINGLTKKRLSISINNNYPYSEPSNKETFVFEKTEFLSGSE